METIKVYFLKFINRQGKLKSIFRSPFLFAFCLHMDLQSKFPEQKTFNPGLQVGLNGLVTLGKEMVIVTTSTTMR